MEVEAIKKYGGPADLWVEIAVDSVKPKCRHQRQRDQKDSDEVARGNVVRFQSDAARMCELEDVKSWPSD